MRLLLSLVMVVIVAAACRDGPTDVGPVEDEGRPLTLAPTESSVHPIDDDEECDPMTDLNFCEEDPCDQQTMTTMMFGTMSGGCDGGGGGTGGDDGGPLGGGGGSGDGGSDEGITDAEFEEMCREEEENCDPRGESAWDETEVSRITAAISKVSLLCPEEGGLLLTWRLTGRLWLWDGRVIRGNDVLRGRADPTTHHIYMWTGYNWEPDDGSPVNWTETLAHEALHVRRYRGEIALSHDEIRAQAKVCAGTA